MPPIRGAHKGEGLGEGPVDKGACCGGRWVLTVEDGVVGGGAVIQCAVAEGATVVLLDGLRCSALMACEKTDKRCLEVRVVRVGDEACE